MGLCAENEKTEEKDAGLLKIVQYSFTRTYGSWVYP